MVTLIFAALHCTEAVFDVRISPHVHPSDITGMLSKWCKECSAPSDSQDHGVEWNYVVSSALKEHQTTSIDPAINPWWPLFVSTIESFDASMAPEPMVFPAATDSRFLRAMGIRAFGFSPIRRSRILLHEHDEYLDDHVFLEGIQVYVHLIAAVARRSRFEGDEF
jgi:aminoacylase